MMADLELSGHTAHLPSIDHTHAGQLLGRISTPGVLPKVLPAIAMPIKDDSTNLTSLVIGPVIELSERHARIRSRPGQQVQLSGEAE
jgi:hypothetical protein